MSGKAPYGPPLDRVVDCVCEVYLTGTPLSIHEAAQICGQYHSHVIDSRTLERYVRRDQAVLNRRTSKKCGKKVQEKCVKKGFEIVQSLDGTLRDRRKPFPSGPLPEETLDGEDGDVCLAEPESRVNTRLQFSLPSRVARSCKITRGNFATSPAEEIGGPLTGRTEAEILRGAF